MDETKSRQLVTSMCDDIDIINMILGCNINHVGALNLSEGEERILEDKIKSVRDHINLLTDSSIVYKDKNDFNASMKEIERYINDVSNTISRSRNRRWMAKVMCC